MHVLGLVGVFGEGGTEDIPEDQRDGGEDVQDGEERARGADCDEQAGHHGEAEVKPSRPGAAEAE